MAEKSDGSNVRVHFVWGCLVVLLLVGSGLASGGAVFAPFVGVWDGVFVGESSGSFDGSGSGNFSGVHESSSSGSFTGSLVDGVYGGSGSGSFSGELNYTGSGSFDGSLVDGELEFTTDAVIERRVREYPVLSIHGTFTMAAAEFDFTPFTLDGDVDVSESKTLISYRASAGFAGTGTSSFQVIPVVDNETLDSLNPDHCMGDIILSSQGSGSVPSRGGNYMEAVCVLPYFSGMTDLRVLVVETQVFAPYWHVEIRQVEVYNHTSSFTGSGSVSGNMSGSWDGSGSGEMSGSTSHSESGTIDAGVSGTTAHTGSGTMNGTLDQDVSGDWAGVQNGTLEGSQSGEVEIDGDAFTIEVANQTVGNMTFNDNATQSVGSTVIEGESTWVDSSISVVELVEFMEMNNGTISTVELVSQFDNRTQITNFSADQPSIEYMENHGSQVIFDQSVNNQENLGNQSIGNQSVGNQSVQTQVNMPDNVSNSTLEFWAPMAFFFLVAAWAWVQRKTLPAAVASVGLIGSMLGLAWGVLGSMVLLMIALWIDYVLEAPGRVLRGKRGM